MEVGYIYSNKKYDFYIFTYSIVEKGDILDVLAALVDPESFEILTGRTKEFSIPKSSLKEWVEVKV